MKTRSALRFAFFVGCLAGVLVVSTAPAAGATDDIEIENVLSQSEVDDRIDVETRLSIPDSTTELEIVIPEGTEVYETNGFRRVDERTYEWTETTATPSLEYEYEGSVFRTREDREEYFFVVADEWALVRTPSIGVSWRTSDTDSELVRENAVDGEGIASSHMAYLGPFTEHTGSAADQGFRLVVPDAAELRENPEDIVATLEGSAERLSIGGHPPDVFVIAAPTAEHTWASAGLQRGNGGDMWVRDAERLGTDRDTWIHEYVHTRQRHGSTDETRWTFEGMADYYAALLPYEAGEIDYGAFADRLEEGEDDEYDDVVLADPGTWEGTDADYDRGMAVFAHLDRRLRAEANTTLDALVADLNAGEGELTQRRFLDAVESAGGSEIRADAERYTETTAVPPTSTRSEHVAAFGGPDVRYSIEGVAVSGPYRDGTLNETGSGIVTGETLETNVMVENLGSDAGEFLAELRIDGETIVAESGRLEPGETKTVVLAHRFDAPGEYELSVGSSTQTVTVQEPAAVSVVDLDAEPSEAEVNETVTLRVTVVPAEDRPAEGEVVFAVDGELIGGEPVRIANGSTTVETSVSFDESGERTVSAGDRSITVAVRGSAESTDDAAEAEPDPIVVEDQPGFGPAVAVLAVACTLLAAKGRR